MLTLLVTCAVLCGQGGIPPGLAKLEIATGAGRERLEVFTYKPLAYRDGPILVVCHGAGRNAEEHRDHARPLADRHGLLVVAPRFDEERFGSDRYHRGGLFRVGKLMPRSEWTWNMVLALVNEVRRREQRPALPYYLFGHSAGGQFLTRMAGFVPTDARRIVIANPSAYLTPSRASAYPYGFGGLPDDLSGDECLRRYLAQPITIYLGADDARSDEFLDESADANRQGRSRFERGRNVYRQAEALARSKGWEFRWTLVEAPGVAHDHRGMLQAPECALALFGLEGAARPKHSLQRKRGEFHAETRFRRVGRAPAGAQPTTGGSRWWVAPLPGLDPPYKTEKMGGMRLLPVNLKGDPSSCRYNPYNRPKRPPWETLCATPGFSLPSAWPA